MTGYGRYLAEGEGLSVRVEVRSVNHKYKDINIKLPRQFAFAEPHVRRLVDSYVARGRVDVYIQVEFEGVEGKEIRLNRELVSHLWEQIKTLCSELSVPMPNFSVVLREALEVRTEVDEDRVLPVILSGVEGALKELINFRAEEGERLKLDILSKLNAVSGLVDKAESLARIAVEEARERLLSRMRELEIDDVRVAQEIAIMLDKMDVNEEIVRLKSHISAFEETISGGSPCGRRLDFIVQEMFREANTLGVKSVDTKLTMIAVELKDQLEKIREQVQNIE